MAKEPIAQGQSSPSIPADGTREVTIGKTPVVEPSMPYTEYADVTSNGAGRGFGEIAWDSAKWLMREALMPALEKLIPQGAAELAQGLFTGQSYVPYGPTEKPVENPDISVGIHGAAQPEANPHYPETSDYEERLAMYASRSNPDKDRSITR